MVDKDKGEWAGVIATAGHTGLVTENDFRANGRTAGGLLVKGGIRTVAYHEVGQAPEG